MRYAETSKPIASFWVSENPNTALIVITRSITASTSDSSPIPGTATASGCWANPSHSFHDSSRRGISRAPSSDHTPEVSTDGRNSAASTPLVESLSA
jgi:hypothetical protein